MTLGPRPYEVTVLDVSGGYEWQIEARGEVIAGSWNKKYTFPRDAHGAAREWAWRHEQLGWEFRPEWWLPDLSGDTCN